MAKVLVIDDDGIVRDALYVFLTRDGHSVITAADGAAGVKAFKDASPDLVVLDRDLPVMSGSGVFSGIRQISTTVPIIILSGYDAPEDVDSYMRNGACAFISKGTGLSPVLDAISQLLGSQRKAAAARTIHPSRRASPAETGIRKAGLLLIADDDASTVNLLRRFLSPMFEEVIEAGDGDSALELARTRKPDVVLLDINMPNKNGVSVLHKLSSELPHTGFIMITGNEDEEVARECLESGAFDYVAKPINLEALRTTIRARLFLQK